MPSLLTEATAFIRNALSNGSSLLSSMDLILPSPYVSLITLMFSAIVIIKGVNLIT